jgi:uncharacterized lipoprotein YmbA
MIACSSRSLRALAPLIAIIISACATSQQPTSYYTLMPDANVTNAVTDSSYLIEVMPVDVPMQVDVPQMVVRVGNGELVPVDTRRWIAPLPNELRNALSWQLTHTLGVRDVAGFSKNANTPTYRITLRVQRFDSAPGAYARIDALWSIRGSDKDAGTLVCTSSANIPVGSGYAALAQGHQQALAQIAGDIAAGISSARKSDNVAGCPAKQ